MQQVVLIDDTDGSPASATIELALDGVSYQIDLSGENEKRLREMLAPYLSVARRTTPVRSAGKRQRSGARGHDPAVVRAWLISQGHALKERGRVPGDLVRLWEDAGRPGAPATEG